MIQGECTLISAMRDYFSDQRKIEISEFKDLSRQDKIDLREMLIAEGYDVAPLAVSPPQT